MAEKSGMGDLGAAAQADWQRQSGLTDQAVEHLKSGSTNTIEMVTTRAAIVGAQSNRELGAAVSAMTVLLSFDVKLLTAQIETFTEIAHKDTSQLARWTKWLVFATFFLAFAALGAAAYQGYVAEKAPPQLLVLPSPKP